MPMILTNSCVNCLNEAGSDKLSTWVKASKICAPLLSVGARVLTASTQARVVV